MKDVGTIFFKLLSPEAVQPSQVHEGDAGFDLVVSRPATIFSHAWADVHTDVAIQLPNHLWAEITGRSSTLRNRGVQVQNGVIDAGYRGELFVACYNFNEKPVHLQPGDRIAQLIPHPLFELRWIEREQLDDSSRGGNGFGSTGE